MSRRWLGVIGIAGLLIAGLFALELEFPQAPPRHAENYRQTNHEDHPSYPEDGDGEPFWQATLSKPEAFFAACVAIFTAVLAVSTIGLWFVTWRIGRGQLRDMQQMLAATQLNANAAARQANSMYQLEAAARDQSLFIRDQARATASVADATLRSSRIAERALTELERPFVYAAVTQPGFKIAALRLARDDFEISFRNVGRTPAILTRIHYKITTARHGSGPDAIDPRVIGGRAFPDNTIIVRDILYSEQTSMLLRFIDEQDDIIMGRQSIWVIGFLRYRDIFDGHHIIGFCQVFDRRRERFVTRGDEHHNYVRKENPEEIPEVSSSGE